MLSFNLIVQLLVQDVIVVGCSGGDIATGSTGLWTVPSGCVPSSSSDSCPASPVQDGYIIASGSSVVGSTRTVTCGSGFTGTASSITCQSNGQWTVSSGCTGSTTTCSTSPVFDGYIVASGSSTAGCVKEFESLVHVGIIRGSI
jgi:hypothetical protein